MEPGTPLVDVVPLSDVVLELETTHNRPDLLGVYGIARDVAAIFDLALAPPPGVDPQQAGDEQVAITIDDLEGCPRYVGRLFRDVAVAPSPLWLKGRLVAAGMRPISNVVDVTNYVMHALGSPMHAFDFDTLAGGRIGVRRAKTGEQLRTLDGQLRSLDRRDLVITDGERAIGIAGIMGGEETEVTESTTAVLLEAANFEAVGIMQSSERLRLRSEASNRWEKGVDPEAALQASRYATELLVSLAGARWTGQADVRAEPATPTTISYRTEHAEQVVGIAIAETEQRRRLEALGFDVSDEWVVRVPTWRAGDVTRAIDLVEEVARFDLERVPATQPARRELSGRLTRQQRIRRRIQDTLVGFGFAEAYTWSLLPEDSTPGQSGCSSRFRASRQFSGRRSPTAWSPQPFATSTQGTMTSRCSSSLTSTCRAASSSRTSAGTSEASSKAASRTQKAWWRACTPRCTWSRRSNARPIFASPGPERGRARDGCSSSSTSACRARGVSSSSTSTASSVAFRGSSSTRTSSRIPR